MAKTNPETILLHVRGGTPPIWEGQAGEDITPGMLVEFTSTAGEFDKQDTANSDCRMAIALEQELQGRGIDDEIKDGDRFNYALVGRGDRVYALVAASAVAIALGDPLTSDNDGGFKKWAAGQPVLAFALEAVDNSSNASSKARIRIEVA